MNIQEIKQANGFTLIELLVVVLIIGILAAVALPQYQVAVTKSRAVEAIVHVKALAKAEELFFLANGQYTTNLADLDIAPDTETSAYATPNWSFVIRYATYENVPRIYAANNTRYIYYYLSSKQLLCATKNDDTIWKKVCTSLSNSDGFTCPWDGTLSCYPINH